MTAVGRTAREWQEENVRKDENKYLEDVFYADVQRFIICSYLLH